MALLEATRFLAAVIPGLDAVQIASLREFAIAVTLIVVMQLRPEGAFRMTNERSGLLDQVRFKILATDKKRFWTMQSELESAGEEFAKMFAAGGLPRGRGGCVAEIVGAARSNDLCCAGPPSSTGREPLRGGRPTWSSREVE